MLLSRPLWTTKNAGQIDCRGIPRSTEAQKGHILRRSDCRIFTEETHHMLPRTRFCPLPQVFLMPRDALDRIKALSQLS